MATRCVALLRGINVGKARQVDMTRLREVLGARGHTDVRTHLRSGNVVLDTGLAEGDLVRDVEAAVREEFGFDVPVVVRTAAALAEVIAADPLGDVATDPARYLVTFLPVAPAAERLASLPPEPEDDRFRVLGRELYQWLPGGVLGSATSGWRWGELLGVTGTARNWNTVRRLAELAG